VTETFKSMYNDLEQYIIDCMLFKRKYTMTVKLYIHSI